MSEHAPASTTPGGAATPMRSFSRRTVFVMIVVGALSFSAYFVLSAYAPELRSGLDGRAHALSKSAVGFAGVVSLLRERGAPVVVQRGRDDAFGDGLLVLTPPSGAREALAEALDPRIPTLVVLPKWNTAPHLRTPGFVQEAGLANDNIVADLLPSEHGEFTISRWRDEARHEITAVDPALPWAEPLTSGPIRRFQTVSADTLEPVLQDEGGNIVLGRIADSWIYVLSEPDLLNTQGLADIDTAWLGVRLLESLAESENPIQFDVTLWGFERTRNLLKLAFEPPFLAATLCALAAAIAMGLHAAAQFGPTRREGRVFALGKRTLVENTAALVRMTRREARMAHGYAALTLTTAARAVSGRHLTDEAAQRKLLDRLSEVAGLARTYSQLAEETHAVSDRAQLLEAARSLHAWRTEIARERR